MVNPLKGLGDIYKLQKVQKALQQEELTIEKEGVRVVMRGDQHVVSIEIDGNDERRVTEALNDAVKESQEHAARMLMEMSKDDQQ